MLYVAREFVVLDPGDEQERGEVMSNDARVDVGDDELDPRDPDTSEIPYDNDLAYPYYGY